MMVSLAGVEQLPTPARTDMHLRVQEQGPVRGVPHGLTVNHLVKVCIALVELSPYSCILTVLNTEG